MTALGRGDARTSALIFPIPELVAYVSRALTLELMVECHILFPLTHRSAGGL